MTWKIDQTRSRIGFWVKHLLVSKVRGEFKRYRAAIEIDRDDFMRSTFEGEIELDSIDTGNAERDGLLRSHEVLSDARHPRLTFRSTAVEPRGAGEYLVRGALGLRGVERDVALTVAFPGVTRAANGAAQARLRVSGSLSRTAFGVNFGVLEAGGLSVGDSVNVELDVYAVEQ